MLETGHQDAVMPCMLWSEQSRHVKPNSPTMLVDPVKWAMNEHSNGMRRRVKL